MQNVSPTVLVWSEVSQFGIALADDPTKGQVRHAGHVNAVLVRGDGDVLVGADTGGVWQLSPQPGSNRVVAVSLSTDWFNPDILCLALGPDGSGHAYAGCRSLTETLPIAYSAAPVLYEAAPTTPSSWLPIMDGAQFGSVYGVGVAQEHRVVAATTTGVWWADIPPAEAVERLYMWQAAQWPGAPNGAPVGCMSLAMSAGLPVVAAGVGGTIWWGEWFSGGALVMQQGFAGLIGSGRTSIAACANEQQILWGVIAVGGNKGVESVIWSGTSGREWTRIITPGYVHDGPTPTPLAAASGNQGDYNNCIAVSPNERDTVLIGWQNGTFVTTDGGASYTHWSNPHLHADVHAIYFDPRDPTGRTVFIGSDGGLAQTTDFGGTFDTTWNQSLANVQFESVPCHNSYGTTSADSGHPGLVAGGLQDNGVVWGNGGPWHEILGADGGAAVHTTDGRLVACTDVGTAQLFAQAPSTVVFLGQPPYRQPDGTLNTGGLNDPVMEAVSAPGHAGPPVVAVGGNGPPGEANLVFGLRYQNPDASDARWDLLATLPKGVNIWSVAAPTDATIYVGTNPAHVYRLDLDVTGWPVTELTGLPPLSSNSPTATQVITRLVALPDGSVLAAYTDSPYTGGAITGQILRYNPTTSAWNKPLNGPGTGLDFEPIFGLEVDPWGVLYAATDDAIYVADKVGAPWQKMPDGLPRRAHLGNLRFMRYPDQGIDLFVTTYGRGTWRARWAPPPTPPSGPRLTGPGLTFNLLIGDVSDGRLYMLRSGRLLPVGPIDPQTEQRARVAATTLTDRATELAAALDAETRNATGQVDPVPAIGQLRAWTNQLQRGISTLEFISLDPRRSQLDYVRANLTDATDMIRAIVTALPHRNRTSVPRPVAAAADQLAAALTAYLAAMGDLNSAAQASPI